MFNVNINISNLKNNENDIRYFIGGTNEIKNKLGTKYYIYTI